MVKAHLLIGSVAALMALSASSASAALVFDGEINPTTFIAGIPSAFDLAHATIVKAGTTQASGWNPYGVGNKTDSWLDVTAGGSAAVYAKDEISFVWGSPNTGNIVTLYEGGKVTGVYDTADLASYGTKNTSGPGYLVTITGDFNKAVFSQTNSGSFEIGVAAPEASSWAMLGIGFAGLALLGHRARRPMAVAA